ncbi:MAG: AAA family ATPase [Nitrospirales bacterium]|nr:AAA family ATPase [Nitrospira sp.]MDR4500861.1 AAA family ATPase [Nitrospirales bacterium]
MSRFEHESLLQLQVYLNQQVIGQEGLILRLLIALLADGHLLVEGAPGLAKTTAIKSLASGIEADFHRVQFTPDLLPADITGTDIYRPQDGSFAFQQGPIFHNLLLADEINRAPAKVQAALLEAMAERQVTIGRKSYPLPELFLVMATQNPIEQEGTYPLPEAQLDRFLLYVQVGYPDLESERKIAQLVRRQAQMSLMTRGEAQAPIPQKIIFSARQEILHLHLAPSLEEYIVQLVVATRDPSPYSRELARWVRYGASPRATIGIERCARAHAWLAGREYVSPEDIQAIAADVLRHRILLSFEAEAENITSDHVITEILSRVAVP